MWLQVVVSPSRSPYTTSMSAWAGKRGLAIGVLLLVLLAPMPWAGKRGSITRRVGGSSDDEPLLNEP